MSVKNEGRHTAEFIVSEANPFRSREEVTIRNTDLLNALEAGTLLGVETSGGNYVRHDSGASDGSETVAGILYEEVEAADTTKRTIIKRDAEVNDSSLIYEDGATENQKATARTQLATLGIIVRF